MAAFSLVPRKSSVRTGRGDDRAGPSSPRRARHGGGGASFGERWTARIEGSSEPVEPFSLFRRFQLYTPSSGLPARGWLGRLRKKWVGKERGAEPARGAT